ncbi:MAG: hypothetical protein AAGJ35_15820, partial [Myxococcota bacterium]
MKTKSDPITYSHLNAIQLSPEDFEDYQAEGLSCIEYLEEKLITLESQPQNQAIWQRVHHTYARLHEIGWFIRLRPGLELLHRVRSFLNYMQGKQLEWKLDDIHQLILAGECLKHLLQQKTYFNSIDPSPPPVTMEKRLQAQYDTILTWLRRHLTHEETVQRMHAGDRTPALGELLLAQGLISPPVLQEVIRSKGDKAKLGETLIQEGHLSLSQIQSTLDLQQDFKKRTHNTFQLDTHQMLQLRGWIGEMGAMLHMLQQELNLPLPT